MTDDKERAGRPSAHAPRPEALPEFVDDANAVDNNARGRKESRSSSFKNYFSERNREYKERQNAIYERLSSIRVTNDQLDRIPKVLVFLSAIVYLAGLFVVNFWLGQFGFYSLDLVRLTYVSAGFWCLLPPMILFLMAFVPGEFLPEGERLFRLKSWSKRLWVLSLLWGLGFALKDRLEALGFEVMNVGWIYVFSGAFTLFLSISIFLPGLLVYFYDRHFESRYTAAISLFWTTLAVVAYLRAFAGFGYGLIPQRFGGGKPIAVQLLLTEEGARHLSRVYEIQNDGTALTDKVPLLIETNDEYVLQAGRSAIALKRSHVQLAIYQPESKVGNQTPVQKE